MGSGIVHTKEVIWILVLVGLLIPAWSASGVIPFLIDRLLVLLHPSYFLTFCFLASALIAMILGTSTGTLSAVGLPLMGAALVLDISPAVTAGALVSGAFVGDRTSPFSSAHQLVAASTSATLKEAARALMPTTLGAVAVSVAVYGGLDAYRAWFSAAAAVELPDFADRFALSPWLLVPPVLLVGSILAFRLRIRYAFLLAIGTAIGLGSLLQGVAPADWPALLWSGYTDGTAGASHGKGLADMLEVIVLIAMAGAFNGILEQSGALKPFLERLLGSRYSLPAASARTGLFGLVLGLISCTQTLPIMMSGRMVRPYWIQRYAPAALTRTVADTSLVLAALIPWNLLAVLCATILGVPTESYAVYAPFLWSLPLITILVSLKQGRKAEGRRSP